MNSPYTNSYTIIAHFKDSTFVFTKKLRSAASGSYTPLSNCSQHPLTVLFIQKPNNTASLLLANSTPRMGKTLVLD